MNREEYLKNLIEIKYGNVKAFSEHIKLPYTTIRSILDRGIMNAKMGNIIKICDGLGIYPEDLVHINNSVINKITKIIIQLSPKEQDRVYRYSMKILNDKDKFCILKIENDKKGANLSTTHYSDICTDIKVLGIVSAGTGEFQTGDRVEETVSYYGSVPQHDYALKVNGDSMTPMLEDNQIIFIKKIDGNSIHNGQIVIALLNGQEFVKKIDISKDKISLVSLNPQYETINISENDNFTIQGIVVL